MREYPNEQAARMAAEVAAVEIKKILNSYDAELDIDRLREGVSLITYYGDPGEGKFIEIIL